MPQELLLSCVGPTAPCMLCGHGPFANTPVSLLRKKVMPFIAEIWLQDKKGFRWRLTFPHTAAMTVTMKEWWETWEKRGLRLIL